MPSSNNGNCDDFRIASQLSKMNYHWKSDRVFQETRKIIGAMIQKITYEDFLPRVLGPSFTRQLGRYRYDPYGESPNIKLEFSTASYRFGHGLIRVSRGQMFLFSA